MAKLVRSICIDCRKPTVYDPKMRRHKHRDGRDSCPHQWTEITMETLIERL